MSKKQRALLGSYGMQERESGQAELRRNLTLASLAILSSKLGQEPVITFKKK